MFYCFCQKQAGCERAIGEFITIERKCLVRPNSVVLWVCTVSNDWNILGDSRTYMKPFKYAWYTFICAQGTKPFLFFPPHMVAIYVRYYGTLLSVEICVPILVFEFVLWGVNSFVRTLSMHTLEPCTIRREET